MSFELPESYRAAVRELGDEPAVLVGQATSNQRLDLLDAVQAEQRIKAILVFVGGEDLPARIHPVQFTEPLPDCGERPSSAAIAWRPAPAMSRA